MEMLRVLAHLPSRPAIGLQGLLCCCAKRPTQVYCHGRLLITLIYHLDSLGIGEELGCTDFEGAYMNRQLALKIALALVGILFLALAYPLAIFIRRDPGTSMMFSLYVTLGVFLLLAIRNPSESRSLIAFTAWSSFAHAAIMGTQACRNMVARGELIGVAVLVVIGTALLALAPAKQPAEPAS
jgi:hypothetical protein